MSLALDLVGIAMRFRVSSPQQKVASGDAIDGPRDSYLSEKI